PKRSRRELFGSIPSICSTQRLHSVVTNSRAMDARWAVTHWSFTRKSKAFGWIFQAVRLAGSGNRPRKGHKKAAKRFRCALRGLLVAAACYHLDLSRNEFKSIGGDPSCGYRK